MLDPVYFCRKNVVSTGNAVGNDYNLVTRNGRIFKQSMDSYLKHIHEIDEYRTEVEEQMQC